MKRKTIITIERCPLNDAISLEDCKKCPYHTGYDSWRKEVDCEKLTESEAKMQPEPVKDSEYKSKW